MRRNLAIIGAVLTIAYPFIKRFVSIPQFVLGAAFGWVFLSQSGSVKGFERAVFSGLPTNELARVMRDVVLPQTELHGLYHVSSDPISKFDLLSLVAKQYGKEIEIVPDDQLVIDRSLNSSRFFKDSGYKADEWPELIRRMHENDQTWSNENV